MINWLNLIIEELRFYELYKCNILDFIGLVRNSIIVTRMSVCPFKT